MIHLRRWREIRFRWLYGFWCSHAAMTWWQPTRSGLYQERSCAGCGITEMR